MSFLCVAFTSCNEFILCLCHTVVRGVLICRSLFYHTFREQQPVESLMRPRSGADPKAPVICSVQLWIGRNQSPARASWRLRVNEKQEATVPFRGPHV